MNAVATLDYAKPLQVSAELARLIELFRVNGVRSYLEIGARYGGSFEAIMRALEPGARGLAVDFPGGNFGDMGSADILLSTINRLRRDRPDIGTVFGPSTALEVIERVRATGPFDAVLIDADHSYEAVQRDFAIYSQMAKIVVLHDIAAPTSLRSRTGLPVEVPKFWDKIKRAFSHIEIVEAGSDMGFGVLWINHPNSND